MKKLITIVLYFVLIFPAASFCKPLTVLYFDRPPYYETVGDSAEGLLVEKTRRIFLKAGIKPEFKSIPPQRILVYIKSSDHPVCSIGWFKTKKREAFCKFSIPIYQNQPLVILTTRRHQERIEQHQSIKDVLFDQYLVMAKVDSFSYGTTMDQWMEDYAARIHAISSHQEALPRMILAGRASYMLIAPEEIETMLLSADLDPKMFVTVSKPDMPKGNLRYIIFSRSVPNETVERINTAIRQIALAKGTD